MVVRAEGQTGTARVGWVVRKGLGHAVARNRIKRRLRHAASEVLWPEGYDYVVIASPAVLDTEFRTVVRWLREAVEMER